MLLQDLKTICVRLEKTIRHFIILTNTLKLNQQLFLMQQFFFVYLIIFLPHSIYWLLLFMGCLMSSFLLSTCRSLNCLLLEPGLISQSLSSLISDVRPAHHYSTETPRSGVSFHKIDTMSSMKLHETWSMDE